MLEYPKRFVKYQLSFLLEGLTIRLVDEDLVLHRNEATTILTLKLESVGVHLRQRPAAANLGTNCCACAVFCQNYCSSPPPATTSILTLKLKSVVVLR